MKTAPRVVRWSNLRKKLRDQIMATKSSARLQTLVKRLNIVNRDNRERNRANGCTDLPEHVDATVSEVIAKIKERNIS